MGVFFALHVVDRTAYAAVLDLLPRHETGDAVAHETLVRRARDGLVACRVYPWNAGPSILEDFEMAIDGFDAGGAGGPVGDFGLAAVCLISLPQFQFWPRYEPDEPSSPTFVSLAEADGGFYGLFCRDRRVDDVLITSRPSEPYPIGEGTILLDASGVQILCDAATGTTVADENVVGPLQARLQRETKARLVRLCQSAIADPNLGVFFSAYP